MTNGLQQGSGEQFTTVQPHGKLRRVLDALRQCDRDGRRPKRVLECQSRLEAGVVVVQYEVLTFEGAQRVDQIGPEVGAEAGDYGVTPTS